jgi:peptide/nickel transport system substrate-binding protein
MMTRYTPDTEIDLQKASGYWNGDAPFDRIIYRNIPEAATQKLTLQAGDIDIATDISPDAVADLQANPQGKVIQGQGTNIFFLLMNEDASLTSGTMSNPLVQNAVRYALDYDGINALVGGPAATPASILPLGFLGAYLMGHSPNASSTASSRLRWPISSAPTPSAATSSAGCSIAHARHRHGQPVRSSSWP